MNKHSFIYRGLLGVLGIYLLIALILSAERAGIQVDGSSRAGSALLPRGSQIRAEDAARQLPVSTLVLIDSADPGSMDAAEQFRQIFLDMKVGYREVDAASEPVPPLEEYAVCVVLLSRLDTLGEAALKLTDYVREGGRAMFALTLEEDHYCQLIERKLGIMSSTEENVLMDCFCPDEDFMIGGGQEYRIVDAYDSARGILLDEECRVVARNGSGKGVPLVWTRDYGAGRFVVVNIGICEKATRGFYAMSYSLLEDYCVWPVLDGSVFYLDDFPSPVPGGDGEYVRRDYQMSVADFYANVWWPDLLFMARRYQILYTGVMIENYEADTSGDVVRQEDTSRFQYFGNMLLHAGGEIGFHGYNHQPLCLPDVDYGEFLPYETWDSEEAMRKAVKELTEFGEENFPTAQLGVYVPPSNIISPQGIRLLAEEFPRIRTIASNYFSGEMAYEQEFGVGENGIINQPRIVSGANMGDYEKMVALSELNMHLVFTHFMHPDDVLDEDRGAALGWKTLRENMEKIVDWLYSSAPWLRRLTGSSLSAEIQRYSAVTVSAEPKGDHLLLELGNFQDECHLLLRLNPKAGEDGLDKQTVVSAAGAEVTPLTGSLYLVDAKSGTVDLTLGREPA